MDNYIKSVIFILVLALSAWDITRAIAPQGSVNQRTASQSFLQQESNLQPFQPTVSTSKPGESTSVSSTAVQNTRRDYVNPQNPSVNVGQQRPQSNTGGSSIPQPNPNTRDYSGRVNPNTNVGTSSSVPGQQGVPHSNPAGGSSIPQPNPNTRRDYVNPNPGRVSPSTNVRPSPDGGSPSVPTPNSNRRDYVNPNPDRVNPNPNSGASSPVPNQQTLSYSNAAGGSSISQPNPNTNRRDYVNPNAGRVNPNTNIRTPSPVSNQQGAVSYSNVAGGSSIPQPNPNTNTRDYVAPQRPGQSGPNSGFPALPASGGANRNPSPGSPTSISYAQRVAGGATTKSPVSTTQSSLVGTPTSSTTEKPDEGPNDTELRDFSEALLRRDVNNAAKFITVNYQGKTTSQSETDEAPQRLLEIRSEAFEIPTIAKLKHLHNNYILETNVNEHVTPQEKAEENDLLDAMLTTPIMQYTRNFLISKGKLSKDPKDFKTLLKQLWFNMYSRGGGKIGSSGFEHIFLAELKNKEVSGMHNWVYFDQAELNNIVNYLGYMKKVDLGEKGAILKLHFKLNGVNKPVGSMFIGTSPELEVALYTTCFIFRADRICPLRLNGNNFVVRAYNLRYRGKNLIGSAFPEI